MQFGDPSCLAIAISRPCWSSIFEDATASIFKGLKHSEDEESSNDSKLELGR